MSKMSLRFHVWIYKYFAKEKQNKLQIDVCTIYETSQLKNDTQLYNVDELQSQNGKEKFITKKIYGVSV